MCTGLSKANDRSPTLYTFLQSNGVHNILRCVCQLSVEVLVEYSSHSPLSLSLSLSLSRSSPFAFLDLSPSYSLDRSPFLSLPLSISLISLPLYRRLPVRSLRSSHLIDLPPIANGNRRNQSTKSEETTPLAGSSAGVIVSMVNASGNSMQDGLKFTKNLAKDCRLNGTAFRLGVKYNGLSIIQHVITTFIKSRPLLVLTYC
ncbi:uncharacterized protein LOC131225414 [Magnolia sinica]|uniref:uncharacterized protein LOC131225414 n=1 Tax=Magnolia sinica TaxID=86752 RepID=UPI0026593711|nr:uncharacterized protein LOC131225414 [Magnolia sinica]